MASTVSPSSDHKQFPCVNCGATLFWDPGTTTLKCRYCGTENAVDPAAAPGVPASPVQENDFQAYLAQLSQQVETVEAMTVRCSGCGSEQTLAAGQTAGTCAFCGTAIVAQASVRRLIKPAAVLPFAIPREQASERFQRWMAGLWFAPGNLKLLAERDGLKGVYAPAWTYDTHAQTWYQGQRGDDYWDTEVYTETENGQTVTKTRQVRRTRWSYCSGQVFNAFDDILVLAVKTLPPKADALEPWDLASLSPYDDRYLSGFVAESYTIDLAEGFGIAQRKIAPAIDQTIRRDIGGDHQQISSRNTSYHDITFKHILLPMWVSAYRYQGKVYTFLVNARTGQVQGDRPWSAWKIAALILVILIVIGVVVAVVRSRH